MYVDNELVLADWTSLSGTSVVTGSYDFGQSADVGNFDVAFTVQTDGNAAGPANVDVAVELSEDGTTWTEVARHKYTLADFNADILSIRAPLRKGRYARLNVLSGDGTTAFSAGKVFAKLSGLGYPNRDIYGA